MQHEYQIRLRDASAQDRLRVANEEAAKEAGTLRGRNVALQRAKEEQEAEQERTMRKLEQGHQVGGAWSSWGGPSQPQHGGVVSLIVNLI